MNNILIVAGPSAVGKTTIVWKMLENDERFEFVRSATTREKRQDTYSSEYIHISRESFLELIENGGVLEYTEYAGEFYGTPRSELERIHSEGKIPLLILDVVGVHSLCKCKDYSVCGIYVYDGIEVMRERIFSRYLGNGESADGRRRYESRKKQNEEDYRRLPEIIGDFYALVKNEGSPEDSAEKVALAYEAFSGGKEKCAEENLRIAKSLSKTVGADIQN